MEFPISEILGTGTAGVAIIMCVVWLRHLSEVRRDAASHVENIAKTTENVAKAFADLSREKQASVERICKSFEDAATALHRTTIETLTAALERDRKERQSTS